MIGSIGGDPNGLAPLIMPLRERSAAGGPAPHRLYHYTDIRGLHGILESGRIMLSNARFINDYSEIDHGLQLFRRYLKDLLDRSPREGFRPGFERALRGLPRLFESPTDIYIFSFCEHADLLSQWRGYGKGPSAVSIGFETGALLREVPPLFRPVRLLYEDEAKRELIAELAAAVRRAEEPADGDRMARRLLGCARLLVPLFKNSVFAEEREWRLVFAAGDRPPRFRVRGNYLLPYMELPLPGFPGLVREVVVGPCENQERVRQSVEYYFRVKGIEAQIHSSRIPLVP